MVLLEERVQSCSLISSEVGSVCQDESTWQILYGGSNRLAAAADCAVGKVVLNRGANNDAGKNETGFGTGTALRLHADKREQVTGWYG